jgi:hypothetical protein
VLSFERPCHSLKDQGSVITTQFHLLYDDEFTSTVPGCNKEQKFELDQVDWQSLKLSTKVVGSVKTYDEADEDLLSDHLDDSWLTPDEIRAKQIQQ